MDRRVVGVALLVLALVAVAALPSIGGRRVAGTAVASAFPDPPRVGDCLLQPFSDDAVIRGAIHEIPVTAMRFGSCSGRIAAEVVGFWASEQVADLPSGVRTRNPCYQQAAGYAGLQMSGRSMVVPGAPPLGPMIWAPTIGFHAYLVVPGTRERNAGRSWSACLAVPTGRTDYAGTLRAAFTTGQLPVDFGLCWNETDLDQSPTLLSCDQPHRAELLATGWIRDRSQITRPEIDAECVQLAAALLRTSDPTRGGALQIVLDPVRRDGASTPDAPMSVGCFATSTTPQQLSDTVMGLGDRPLPLAG